MKTSFHTGFLLFFLAFVFAKTSAESGILKVTYGSGVSTKKEGEKSRDGIIRISLRITGL